MVGWLLQRGLHTGCTGACLQVYVVVTDSGTLEVIQRAGKDDRSTRDVLATVRSIHRLLMQNRERDRETERQRDREMGQKETGMNAVRQTGRQRGREAGSQTD